MKKENKKGVDVLEIGIIISQRHNTPCLELRKVTSNSQLMKKILKAAWHNKTVIFKPVFHDKIKSVGSLIDKGIIYFNEEEDRYFFNEF